MNITMPDLGNRFLNRLTHILSMQIAMLTSKLGFEQVRRRAGLPKRKLYSPFKDNPPRLRTPILCAWSPSLIPPSSDWDLRVHVTGYYFFSQNISHSSPPDMKSGNPPVSISFESMVNKDAERIDEIICEALKKTDNRGVIFQGGEV